jgi:hypothetical protein
MRRRKAVARDIVEGVFATNPAVARSKISKLLLPTRRAHSKGGTSYLYVMYIVEGDISD